MNLQFYPTPTALARRAWDMFENKLFERVLEPSAGNGDLLDAMPGRGHRNTRCDAIEIDAKRQEVLRSKNYRLVGMDFMDFQNGAPYSHIILNPPFAQGVDHLLHAWDTLFDGEIVAILNAETIRNPHSSQRQHLMRLLAEHGRFEYVSSAFKGEFVDRETDVEVALVHLKKRANTNEVLGDMLGRLKKDTGHHDDAIQQDLHHQVMLPNGFVENAVQVFEVAVQCARESALAQAKADHYANWLGKPMGFAEQPETQDKAAHASASSARNLFAKAYDDLKDRAWTHVLRSTEVSEKLSTTSRNRLQKEFEQIKALEFTAANVYGFLSGLASSGWELALEMLCQTFDNFSRYHEENTVFYMGWKSNGKHRRGGMRLRTTRFILPGFQCDGWRSSLGWTELNQLFDIDRSFAILDGKQVPGFGLKALFETRFNDLKGGERLASDYFDVRFYPARGTIHFFATRKDLVDRLNRIVGQHRQWLPPQEAQDSGQVHPDFERQYARAEQMDKLVRKAFTEVNGTGWRAQATVNAVFRSQQDEESDKASQALFNAVESVAAQAGLDVEGICQSLAALPHTQTNVVQFMQQRDTMPCLLGMAA